MNGLIKIDKSGKISAKEVYEFLKLEPAHYARWAKTNIEENQFALEGVDYTKLTAQGELDKSRVGGNWINPNPTKDYKLTIDFAKKLCMVSKSERGEQARNYFIEVEKLFKAIQEIPKPKSINRNKIPTITAVTGYMREVRRVMEKQGNTPNEIAAMIEIVCRRYDLPLPQNFVRKAPREQITITFENS